MSKSITQDMAYRQSLMKFAEKYGVSRVSRTYNKSHSLQGCRAYWDNAATPYLRYLCGQVYFHEIGGYVIGSKLYQFAIVFPQIQVV